MPSLRKHYKKLRKIRTTKNHKKILGGRRKKSKSAKKRSIKTPVIESSSNNHEKPKVVIGLIYANWCPHCQSLKAENGPWEQMKMDLNEPQYEYVEIEDSQPDKMQRIEEINRRLNDHTLEVNGYPTIFRIRGGNIDYYNGDRTADEMKKWFINENEMKGGCGCENNTSIPKLF